MNKCKLGAMALAFTVLLGGCSQTPAVETTPTPTVVPSVTPVRQRTFALPYSPAGGFHPITGTDRVNLTLAPLLYQGLFSLDEQFEAQKDLCAEYEVSEDGLTWTFTLIEAIFSDGSSLTPVEVATSLNQARRAGRFATRLSNLKRVAAQGDTVVVTLAEPNGNLPALLDVPIVKETGDSSLPLGTGPYYLTGEDVTGKNEWTLVAKYGSEVPFGTIPLRAVTAGDDLIAAFDAGEVSLVDTDLTGANALGYSGKFETTDYATTTLLYIGMNTAGTSVCRDAAVRRAVSLSVNREDVVERLLAGHAVVSALLVHPDALKLALGEDRTQGYDPEAAVAALTEAGWTLNEEGTLKKGRTELALRLLVNQDNSYKTAIAEALAAELEALGCAVALEKLPWEDFATALERGNFDLYLGEAAMTANFDPEPFVGTGGALNYGKFSDKDLDAAIDLWRAVRGEERTEAAEELYFAIAEPAPVVPICFKNGSVLTQWGQFGNLSPTQRNVFQGFENWAIEG